MLHNFIHISQLCPAKVSHSVGLFNVSAVQVCTVHNVAFRLYKSVYVTREKAAFHVQHLNLQDEMCGNRSLTFEFKQSVVGGETRVIPHIRAGLASSEVGREESVRSDEREEGFLPLYAVITTSVLNYKEGRVAQTKGS